MKLALLGIVVALIAGLVLGFQGGHYSAQGSARNLDMGEYVVKPLCQFDKAVVTVKSNKGDYQSYVDLPDKCAENCDQNARILKYSFEGCDWEK